MNARWFAIVPLLAVLGCRPQSAECKKYLECVAALDPESEKTLEARYGSEGTCWTSSDIDSVNCTNACKSGLVSVVGGGTAPDACK
jgi:hypothetical protein